MDKAAVAAKFNVPVSDVASVSINWTAPQAMPVVMLGPKSNVKKWYYTVEMADGSLHVVDEQPSEAEIMEYIKTKHPFQLIRSNRT